MLRFTESIQISKDSITLKFTRVGYFDMGRVSVHTLHFLFHFIGSIGEINAVAQRLLILPFRPYPATADKQHCQATGFPVLPAYHHKYD